MASFSERLKELREEAGLNQKQLAEVIGVRDNTISRWELGGNMPKDQYSMQLAACSFLQSFGALFDGSVG